MTIGWFNLCYDISQSNQINQKYIFLADWDSGNQVNQFFFNFSDEQSLMNFESNLIDNIEKSVKIN